LSSLSAACFGEVVGCAWKALELEGLIVDDNGRRPWAECRPGLAKPPGTKVEAPQAIVACLGTVRRALMLLPGLAPLSLAQHPRPVAESGQEGSLRQCCNLGCLEGELLGLEGKLVGRAQLPFGFRPPPVPLPADWNSLAASAGLEAGRALATFSSLALASCAGGPVASRRFLGRWLPGLEPTGKHFAALALVAAPAPTAEACGAAPLMSLAPRGPRTGGGAAAAVAAASVPAALGRDGLKTQHGFGATASGLGGRPPGPAPSACCSSAQARSSGAEARVSSFAGSGGSCEGLGCSEGLRTRSRGNGTDVRCVAAATRPAMLLKEGARALAAGCARVPELLVLE